ncbi:hypothetical protein B0T40_13450 [Chromobacterium haemolyticum]|nr:hypothetical protein B0T40_13450 [Chromobacterium haemolyticum]
MLYPVQKCSKISKMTEKLDKVRQGFPPGQTESLVAPCHGTNQNQLFQRCKLHQKGSLSVVSTGKLCGTRFFPAVTPSLACLQSGGFKVNCDNGGKVRATIPQACSGREILSWVVGTAGYRGDDMQNVMMESL